MALYLHKLSILNYKNLQPQELEFSEGFNCFTGKNGSGKTNLLDAVYMLGLTRSYFNHSDADNVQHHEDFYRLCGTFHEAENQYVTEVAYGKKQRKFVRVNDEKAKKFSDHIGRFPILIITPDDIHLVKGYSEGRRAMMDQVICQTDRFYLEALGHYQKVLKQRNQYLKNLEANADEDLMDSYDLQLVNSGKLIYEKRSAFLEGIKAPFEAIYKAVSEDNESVEFIYESHLNDGDFIEILKNSRQKDVITRRTLYGLHKDDIRFEMNQYAVKKMASQGQQKSFLIALKLACAEYLTKSSGKKPILLLDDIFDKLDQNRVEALVRFILNVNAGQVFLSDTDYGRIKRIFEKVKVPHRIFEVSEGKII